MAAFRKKGKLLQCTKYNFLDSKSIENGFLNMIKSIKTTFVILVVFAASYTGKAQQIYFPPLVGNQWETISPASLGWCVDKIDTLYTFLENHNTKAFMVLKDGKIVMEKYFGAFNSDSLWYWASAGKTLVGMLTGIAQQEGFLSIDSSVAFYLGQGWTSCPGNKEKLITVRNQLTMTTGLNDGVVDPDCTSPDCLQYLADAGTRWAYHNAPYTILGQVITAATGINFNTYFNSRIRNKIGMNGIWIDLDYNHIYFSNARSMARFGVLLLANGNWNGVKVIQDAEYIQAITNSSQSLNKSYGYLTWLNGKESYMIPQTQFIFPGSLCPAAPADMYAAMGKNGQLINVVPSQGLVIIRMGNAPDNQFEISNVFDNLIWQQLNKVICNITGTTETSLKNEEFTIYPNPANTGINIFTLNSTGEFTVLLYNLKGQLITSANNCRFLNVEGISSGTYVLAIIRNGKRFRYPITIAH